VLKGCLHGETVACGLGLGRPGHLHLKEILLVCYQFPYLRSSLFLQGLFWEGASMLVSQTGWSRAFVCSWGSEGLIRKVTVTP
jgi:hypothetical protein